MRKLTILCVGLLSVSLLVSCGNEKSSELSADTKTAVKDTITSTEDETVNIIQNQTRPELYAILEPYIDTEVRTKTSGDNTLTVEQVLYDGHWLLAGVKIQADAQCTPSVAEKDVLNEGMILPVSEESTGDRYYLISFRSNEVISEWTLLLENSDVSLDIAISPCNVVTMEGEGDYQNIRISPFSVWFEDYTVHTIYDIPSGQASAHGIYIILKDGTEVGYSQEELADRDDETMDWVANESLYLDHAVVSVRLLNGVRLENVAGIRIDEQEFRVSE